MRASCKAFRASASVVRAGCSSRGLRAVDCRLCLIDLFLRRFRTAGQQERRKEDDSRNRAAHEIILSRPPEPWRKWKRAAKRVPASDGGGESEGRSPSEYDAS